MVCGEDRFVIGGGADVQVIGLCFLDAPASRDVVDADDHVFCEWQNLSAVGLCKAFPDACDAQRGGDGTGTLLCDWSELSLSEQTSAGTSVTPLEREAIPELLATLFSLPGFTLAADGRLVLTNAG